MKQKIIAIAVVLGIALAAAAIYLYLKKANPNHEISRMPEDYNRTRPLETTSTAYTITKILPDGKIIFNSDTLYVKGYYEIKTEVKIDVKKIPTLKVGDTVLVNRIESARGNGPETIIIPKILLAQK